MQRFLNFLRGLVASYVSKKRANRLIANLLFLLTAGCFWKVFYESVPDAPFHFARFAAIAFTVWASLDGAFDFAVNQAGVVSSRMRGLNLLILTGCVFCCLLAMASHKSSLAYNAWANVALALYVVWDILALAYFRSRSLGWFRYYRELFWSDLIFLTAFTTIAYVPNLFPLLQEKGHALQEWVHKFASFVGEGSATQISQKELEQLSDGFTGAFLWLQLVSYVFVLVRRRVSRSERNQIVDVQDGYTQWAEIYDISGNAVIDTEREHTITRLHKLDIDKKTIIDLGCGTGTYSKELVARASRVVAIDSNRAMLDRLNQHYVATKPPNLEIVLADTFSVPTSVATGTVDGVLCCLVIDHLEEFRVDQTLGEIFRILKSGGWLYITDVNPYFELLEEPYAKFIDKDGIQQRIKVFPHTVEMVFKSFAKAGFPTPKVTEAKVTQAIANKWNIENLKDFPLILEYFVQKS